MFSAMLLARAHCHRQRSAASGRSPARPWRHAGVARGSSSPSGQGFTSAHHRRLSLDARVHRPSARHGRASALGRPAKPGAADRGHCARLNQASASESTSSAWRSLGELSGSLVRRHRALITLVLRSAWHPNASPRSSGLVMPRSRTAFVIAGFWIGETVSQDLSLVHPDPAQRHLLAVDVGAWAFPRHRQLRGHSPLASGSCSSASRDVVIELAPAAGGGALPADGTPS
jgi:hypothetical protein